MHYTEQTRHPVNSCPFIDGVPLPLANSRYFTVCNVIGCSIIADIIPPFTPTDPLPLSSCMGKCAILGTDVPPEVFVKRGVHILYPPHLHDLRLF